MSRLPANIMINQLFTEFKGALTENFVAQELMAENEKFDKLYYWTSGAAAEVDFVLPYKLDIYPLEVKASISTCKKSLLVYGEKYQPKIMSRITLMNFKQDGTICNYPLYATGLFPIKNSKETSSKVVSH